MNDGCPALSSKKYKDAVMYTSRLVSRHPMEFDTELHDRCCSDLNLCSSQCESHDIYKRIKDRLHVSENSFYFLYPPDFMSMLDDAGLLEFNPYVDNTDDLPTIVGEETKYVVKSNPGFAPYTGQEKYHGYAPITGHFNEWYGSYYHEGTDFKGVCEKTPIKALVFGKVVLAKDQGNSFYGLSLLIKGDRQEDGKNLFYLLGHLSRYETGIGEGSTVSPGQTVGYVGNTGNCYTGNPPHPVKEKERAEGMGAHLHLSVYKTERQLYELYKENSDKITFRTELKDDKNGESDLVNPFDHNEHRRFK